MRKNKLLKIFIAIVLLISIETSVIAASTGVVNVETVRVREKATTDSDIVELVSIGDKITIIGEEENWYKVKVGKVTGYIRKDLLTVEGKTTEVTGDKNNNDASNNSSTSGKPDDKTQNSGDKVDTNNDQATSGDTIPTNGGTVAEEPNGELNGNESSGNEGTTVNAKDTTISTIKASKVGRAGQKIQLEKETKIKILPSANSSNIASISANTEVTVLEIINSWCRIEAGEYVGWVRIDR